MTKNPNHLKQIFDSMIVQVTSTVITILITGAISLFVSKQLHFTTREIWLLIIASVFFIIIVSYVIYRVVNKKLPKYDPIESDFRVICEERVHQWLSENDYVHKRRYTVKALRDGLTEYIDKFEWTGTEYQLRGGDGKYTVEEDELSRNVFTVYRFKFKKPLRKGQEIKLEAIWNAKGPAKPFFSTTIEKQTDTLIMKVKLFPQSGIKTINREVYNNIGAVLPNESNIIDLDSDGENTWVVSSPQILHHYEINWEVNNNLS